MPCPASEDDARRHLQPLISDYERLSAADGQQMSEASVVRQFMDRLLGFVEAKPFGVIQAGRCALRATSL
jgi:hypothetical protein